MRYVLAATFAGAFALSAALLLIVRSLALKAGFVDVPGGRKAHGRAVPLGGGIALAVAACLPLLGAALGSHLLLRNPSLLPVPESLWPDVALAAARLRLVLCVVAGGVAAAALGLWDDLRGSRPAAKLAAQFVIAAAVATVPEVRITLFIESPAAHVAVTTVWLVLLMNCFNLLDNMDGLSGLVAFLTGGALLVLALQTGQYFIGAFLMAFLGAVLAFLFFNFPPASIFMGDAGSMFIGYMLAVATALTAFFGPRHPNPLFPVLVPLVIFAVPLYDVLSVLAIRFHAGRPLFGADRSHFSHRLLRLGMSRRMVLLTVGLVVVATSLGATIPYGPPIWRVAVPAVQAASLIVVIMMLELTSARGPRQESGG